MTRRPPRSTLTDTLFPDTTLFRSPTIPLSVVAQEAEARGFESLFIGEHSHTPVDAVLPKWMGAVGGQPYPEFYRHYPNPYILLAQASALTKRLKLGVAIDRKSTRLNSSH